MTCWNDEYEAHLRSAPGLVFPTTDERALQNILVTHLLQEERDRSTLVSEAISTFGKGDATINAFALRDDISSLTTDDRRRLLKERFPIIFPESEAR